MKRVTHLLADASGIVRAHIVTPEGQTPDIAPWMLQNINEAGWVLIPVKDSAKESGVAAHGFADWQGVADNLAACLRVLLDDSRELNEEDSEQMLEQAQAALDDYDVAHMEVSVATFDLPEDEENDDGSE